MDMIFYGDYGRHALTRFSAGLHGAQRGCYELDMIFEADMVVSVLMVERRFLVVRVCDCKYGVVVSKERFRGFPVAGVEHRCSRP
jgi:hypothetical protein